MGIEFKSGWTCHIVPTRFRMRYYDTDLDEGLTDDSMYYADEPDLQFPLGDLYVNCLKPNLLDGLRAAAVLLPACILYRLVVHTSEHSHTAIILIRNFRGLTTATIADRWRQVVQPQSAAFSDRIPLLINFSLLFLFVQKSSPGMSCTRSQHWPASVAYTTVLEQRLATSPPLLCLALLCSLPFTSSLEGAGVRSALSLA